jgi:L-alanine-DL-glutamate epimerase-like enolase superfamily enzyme
MKITNVEYFHLNPRLCDRYKGHEVRFSGIDTQTVYRVTLHNGVIGYGDERGHITLSEQQISALVDQSPFNYLGASLNAGLMGALYDAMGKAIDEPAYKLLGQKVRDRVPVAAWTRPAPPEDFASEITRAANEGYTIFKMHSDARHDIIAQTRAAQEVAPQGFKLHWDLNHNRPSAAVLRIVDELEKFPVVGFLEDPFFWHDIEGWRLLRSQTMLPILMHVPQLGGGPEIQREVADLYMIGENGLGNSIRRGFAAAAAGLSTVIQLTGGTLSKAMAMHLGAVVPNVSHATTLDDQYAEDVTGIRLEISEGSSPVPEGPGLGVDVDEKILAELAARPKSELPRHLGVLHLPGGTTYYTPSAPNVEQITGFVEGNVRGIRSEFWNDDSSEEFSRVYEQVQKEGTVKKG